MHYDSITLFLHDSAKVLMSFQVIPYLETCCFLRSTYYSTTGSSSCSVQRKVGQRFVCCYFYSATRIGIQVYLCVLEVKVLAARIHQHSAWSRVRRSEKVYYSIR
jgi:hypothetical protein